MRTLLALVSASLALLALAPVAEAARRVPKGFVGTMVDGPLVEPSFGAGRYGAELDAMVRNGVESIRVGFYWARVQPYRRLEDVPASQRSRYRNVGGVPTDFSELDRVVASATRRRIRILPAVLQAPQWAAKYRNSFNSPPGNRPAYGRFMAALVRRYGPSGSFWRERPRTEPLPIRRWQIWNEPYLPHFWADQPFAATYSLLLRDAYFAIKRADPGARVILAGLASYAQTAWKYLDEIYQQGARHWFDGVAANPYTTKPADIIRIIERMRRVMRAHGDSRVAMIISEFTWPSSKGKPKQVSYPWEQTESGQSARISETFRLLFANRRRLRITQVIYYNWLTRDAGRDSFGWSGLRRLEPSGRVVSKPGLTSFRRAALRAEGCSSKRRIASVCYRRF